MSRRGGCTFRGSRGGFPGGSRGGSPLFPGVSGRGDSLPAEFWGEFGRFRVGGFSGALYRGGSGGGRGGSRGMGEGSPLLPGVVGGGDALPAGLAPPNLPRVLSDGPVTRELPGGRHVPDHGPRPLPRVLGCPGGGHQGGGTPKCTPRNSPTPAWLLPAAPSPLCVSPPPPRVSLWGFGVPRLFPDPPPPSHGQLGNPPPELLGAPPFLLRGVWGPPPKSPVPPPRGFGEGPVGRVTLGGGPFWGAPLGDPVLGVSLWGGSFLGVS